MSHHFKEPPQNAITQSGIARVLPCKELDVGDPLKWLSLAFRDFTRAPGLSLFFGVLFTLLPLTITYFVTLTGWHLVILPSMVCFMLIGPFLAAALYDIAWELEKGHKPTLGHAMRALRRNAVHEWGFGILLMVFMIFWLRIASLIHALYPPYLGDNFEELLPFLTLGTIVGALFTVLVFFLTAFTQPILMERKVDLMTAVVTSVHTVWVNKVPMFIWAAIIFFSVILGFITGFLGFLVIMPILGYASWHGYIDAIPTKRPRGYE